MSESSLTETKEDGDETALPLPETISVSVDLSAAEGLPRAVQRRHWAASLTTAFAAHAFVMGAMLYKPPNGLVGADGSDIEAVNVDIISSSVLESLSPSANSETAASPHAVHSEAGAEASKEAAEAADQQQMTTETKESTAAPMPDLVIPDAVEERPPPEPADVALRIMKERPDEPEETEIEVEPEATQTPEPEAATASISSEASEASEEGGATARGIEGVEAAEAQAAAASPGVASDYAKAVLETLARSRPRAVAGVRGTVRIRFTVETSGEVASATVLVSSGQATLDDAVLSTIRGVRFPAPPQALTSAQRSYEIPYYFR